MNIIENIQRHINITMRASAFIIFMHCCKPRCIKESSCSIDSFDMVRWGIENERIFG